MRVIFPIIDTDTQYIGAMTLSSILKAEGHEVFGAEAKINTLGSFISDGKATIIAFTTPTCFTLAYLELNKLIKNKFPNVFSIFGGWHPTYVPEMIKQEGVDAICIGEGEGAMKELCKQLDRKELPSGIRNLWIKKPDGSIEKNPVRPLIQNLEEQPLPDRSFMISGEPEYYYIIASVVTQRSCPFACSFCVNNAFNLLYKDDNPHKRRRSVDHVIAELLQIKSKGKLEFVKFEDSIFIIHPKWIKEFSGKYKKKIDIPFTCFVRSEVITPQVIRDIKNAGAVSVSIGVEVGDEVIRAEVLNKKISNNMLRNAIKVLKTEKLKIRTHNIIGIPGCSIETDFETIRFNAELKPDYAACGFLHPYPGTDIFNAFRAKGLIPSDFHEFLLRMPSSYIEPAIPFPDAKSLLQARNLQLLFALTVNFPWLLPLIKRLINLPLMPLYRLTYAAWKSYSYFFKIWPISPKQLWVLVKRGRRMAS